jgi:hypothetical protein
LTAEVALKTDNHFQQVPGKKSEVLRHAFSEVHQKIAKPVSAYWKFVLFGVEVTMDNHWILRNVNRSDNREFAVYLGIDSRWYVVARALYQLRPQSLVLRGGHPK